MRTFCNISIFEVEQQSVCYCPLPFSARTPRCAIAVPTVMPINVNCVTPENRFSNLLTKFEKQSWVTTRPHKVESYVSNVNPTHLQFLHVLQPHMDTTICSHLPPWWCRCASGGCKGSSQALCSPARSEGDAADNLSHKADGSTHAGCAAGCKNYQLWASNAHHAAQAPCCVTRAGTALMFCCVSPGSLVFSRGSKRV